MRILHASRILPALVLMAFVGLGACLAQRGGTAPATTEDAGEGGRFAKEEAAIRDSARAFEEAYNKNDAEAIGALFLENAELVDEDGNVYRGRDEIARGFAAVFQENPQSRMRIEIEEIRVMGPNVAIEDGLTFVKPDADSAELASAYTAIHVQRDGRWSIGSARDTAVDEPLTPHEQLEPLAWMIGDWIDESPDSVVQTSCRWSDDGNYLLQDFSIQVAGVRAMSGTQRIGWDPLRQQIRSWVFDSEGGFVEGFWTPTDTGWVVTSSGVTPDGEPASGTRIVTQIDDESYTIDFTSRIVGNEVQPDITVVVVRKPPAPAAEGK
jgi:uncharacterized protein (TIGR02246 family)